MSLKRMYEVTVVPITPEIDPMKTMIVLADDEREARTLAADGNRIIEIYRYDGLVSAVGSSRIIG